MIVSIFTPTYNRGYIIEKLYQSLCCQTNFNFEWIIVDDGSIDDTQSIVSDWISEGIIPIKYYCQHNGGKHRAINNGVKYAIGELFFIVDSDDFLSPDAVELIISNWNKYSCKDYVVGLCFRRINYNTSLMIGRPFPSQEMLASTLEIHYKYGIHCDKAEVFRTKDVLNYPFPEITGEKFISEGLIWNKIAGLQTTKLVCINRGIYLSAYLNDGLTNNFTKLIADNPKGFIKYYSSLLKYQQVWGHPIYLSKIIIRFMQACLFLCRKTL